MQKPPLFSRLLNNWPIKLICFAIALLLYVFYQITSLETRSIAVRLAVNADGNMVASCSIPSYVRVSLRGKQEEISLIQESDIEAFLDFSFYTQSGDYDVPVMMNLSKTITVMNPLEVSVSPEYIKVTLEEKDFSLVPVSPVVQGTPARGYEIASYTIMPSSVRITGPESMVKTVTDLSADIVSIDGITESISKKVSIFNTNEYITIDPPAETTVSVEVKPVLIERTYQNIPIFLTLIPENFIISPNKSLSVTVRGPMLEVEKYEFGNYTVQANCSKIQADGDYAVALKFLVPDSFTIVRKTFDSVPVTAVYNPPSPLEEVLENVQNVISPNAATPDELNTTGGVSR